MDPFGTDLVLTFPTNGPPFPTGGIPPLVPPSSPGSIPPSVIPSFPLSPVPDPGVVPVICGSPRCAAGGFALTQIYNRTFLNNGLPTHEGNYLGNNAMLHCAIDCQINKMDPACTDTWNGREGISTDALMDLANNRVGQAVTGDCWRDCFSKWQNDALTCIVAGVLTPCPPPPGRFPQNMPPQRP